MVDILKAKPVVKMINKETSEIISQLTNQPKLALILIGNDPAAEWYVNNLIKKGSKSNIKIELYKYDTTISQAELLKMIKQFNAENDVSGIMLQKPLPSHLDEEVISFEIDPDKDVDGFHPQNLGKLMLDQEALLPCTPQAVIEILRYYEIETSGKHVVILGRSNIVGKPLLNMLIQKKNPGNATVTVCHSQTKNISSYTRNADILISAIGKAGFVTSEMVSAESVVIDVGTNLVQDENGNDHYTGDVDYNVVSEKVRSITPVPGGVGSVTTSLLLRNVARAAKKLETRKIIDGN